MTKIPEYKKKLVADMVRLVGEYPIIGVVNMESLPAPQLQAMRAELRGKVNLFMTKKRLMKIALEKAKNEKKGVEDLINYFSGMPALIFTRESPFSLSRTLQKSKTNAPAKAGQTAPSDIIINKGPTPFAPGPIISELSQVGLKVGVESGKVAVKEDTVIAKKGEKIKPKVAEVLTRLDIKPMQVGLGLVAAYEDGVIYQKEILEIDEKEFNNKVNNAALSAFNLAFNITYPTSDNIALLLGKAFKDATAIGLSQEIVEKGIIEQLIGKAEMSMLGIKGQANIEVPEVKKTAEEAVPKKEEAKGELKSEEKEEAKVKTGPVHPKKAESKAELKEDKITSPDAVQEPRETESIQQAKPEEQAKKVLKEAPKQPEVKEETQKKEPVADKPMEEKTEMAKKDAAPEKETTRAEKQQEKISVKGPEKVSEKEPVSVENKVKELVDKTKKFVEGREEKAEDIIEEVKREQNVEIEEKKKDTEGDKLQVPSAHDLKKQKEDKEKNEVEELAKELLKKGTLRKK